MDSSEPSVVISPVNRIRGELRLPGDKSISHRAAMIASLAEGRSVLSNFSTAHDCAATLDCLRALGVNIKQDGSTVVVEGVGLRGLRKPSQELDAANSGTTMRLLAGILAGQPFISIITGDQSLRRRPMERVAEPLRAMGARIELSNGCAPMRIEGAPPLKPISYRLPIASAQLKSAVLLAGVFAEGVTKVEEPEQTRDHTEILLSEFGASIQREGNLIAIKGGSKLQARDFQIPGDISSAAFLIAAAAALPGSDLQIHDVGLNPTRTAFLATLTEMGVEIEISEARLKPERVGSIRVRGKSLRTRKLEISGQKVSPLIDELPLLACFAASVGSEMTLRDASELRFKECDRIEATVQNLTRMGAKITERDDGWLLSSGGRLKGASLDSFGDHRIAMACAVAALTAEGPSQIDGGGEVVAVSFPEFWDLLESVLAVSESEE